MSRKFWLKSREAGEKYFTPDHNLDFSPKEVFQKSSPAVYLNLAQLVAELEDPEKVNTKCL